MDLSSRGLTRVIAERAMEACGIIVNKNRVPGDRHGALVTGSVRFGTNSLALREMDAGEMPACAELVDRVLARCARWETAATRLAPDTAAAVRDAVAALCAQFPIPGYGA